MSPSKTWRRVFWIRVIIKIMTCNMRCQTDITSLACTNAGGTCAEHAGGGRPQDGRNTRNRNIHSLIVNRGTICLAIVFFFLSRRSNAKRITGPVSAATTVSHADVFGPWRERARLHARTESPSADDSGGGTTRRVAVSKIEIEETDPPS